MKWTLYAAGIFTLPLLWALCGAPFVGLQKHAWRGLSTARDMLGDRTLVLGFISVVISKRPLLDKILKLLALASAQAKYSPNANSKPARPKTFPSHRVVQKESQEPK